MPAGPGGAGGPRCFGPRVELRERLGGSWVPMGILGVLWGGEGGRKEDLRNALGCPRVHECVPKTPPPAHPPP